MGKKKVVIRNVNKTKNCNECKYRREKKPIWIIRLFKAIGDGIVNFFDDVGEFLFGICFFLILAACYIVGTIYMKANVYDEAVKKYDERVAKYEEEKAEIQKEYDKLDNLKMTLEKMGITDVQDENFKNIQFININGELINVDKINNVENFNLSEEGSE